MLHYITHVETLEKPRQEQQLLQFVWDDAGRSILISASAHILGDGQPLVHSICAIRGLPSCIIIWAPRCSLISQTSNCTKEALGASKHFSLVLSDICCVSTCMCVSQCHRIASSRRIKPFHEPPVTQKKTTHSLPNDGAFI